MKVTLKTLKKVVLEVTAKEWEEEGFERIWDKIRNDYPKDSYDIFSVEKSSDSSTYFFELVRNI